MELLEDFGGCAARCVNQEDVKNADTDTCIYVIARQAGEGVDRKLKKGDFYLTDEEYADISFCAEKFAKNKKRGKHYEQCNFQTQD